MSKNIIQHRVEWGETDAAGIVFNPNYYRWFDNATHALFRAIDLPLRELQEKHHFAPPLMESGCKFLAPIYYDDELKLESEVVEVRTRTFKVEHRLYRGVDLVGLGFEVRAWIKLDEPGEDGKLKAVPIPEEMAARLRG